MRHALTRAAFDRFAPRESMRMDRPSHIARHAITIDSHPLRSVLNAVKKFQKFLLATSLRRPLPDRTTSSLLQHLPIGVRQRSEEQGSNRASSGLIKPNGYQSTHDHSEHAGFL